MVVRRGPGHTPRRFTVNTKRVCDKASMRPGPRECWSVVLSLPYCHCFFVLVHSDVSEEYIAKNKQKGQNQNKMHESNVFLFMWIYCISRPTYNLDSTKTETALLAWQL